MKYYSEEQIRDQFDPFECKAFFKRQDFGSINVRLCRDCPFFEIDGVQPFQDVTRGWCRRLSFEGEGKYTPHYIRVDTNSFCNDDHASRRDDIEIL